MTDRSIIGIDPGMSGAVGVIHPAGTYEVFDIPSAKVGAKGKQDYLIGSFVDLLVNLIRPASTWGRPYVVIESPARNSMGSAMTLLAQGRGVGIAEGICAALWLSYEVVEAHAWTGGMGLHGKTKEAHVVKAEQLFPDARFRGPRGGLLDGRADALLIAAWYQRAEGIRARKVEKVTGKLTGPSLGSASPDCMGPS